MLIRLFSSRSRLWVYFSKFVIMSVEGKTVASGYIDFDPSELSKYAHYKLLRNEAKSCALCLRNPQYSSGDSMLIFKFDEHSLVALSAMSVDDQLRYKESGKWLCVFCFKKQARDRVLHDISQNESKETKEHIEKVDSKWKWIHEEMIKIGRCANCQLAVTPDNTWMFEWDHISEKFKSICDLTRELADDSIIRQELARCRLLCAECHTECTYTQRKRKRLLPAIVDEHNNVIRKAKRPRGLARAELQTLWLNKFMRIE